MAQRFRSDRRSSLAAGVAATLAALSALAPAGCTSGDAHREARLTPEERARHVESFDVVWTTIRDKHWDPTLGGIDWPATRDELRPRIETAATAAEARGVIQVMIARLKQSHFSIIPASAYEATAATRTSGEGTTGLRLALCDGQIVVHAVAPDSAAATAGVKPGWIVEAVDDEALAPRLAEVSDAYADSTQLDLQLLSTAAAMLSGDVGDVRELTFRDGSNARLSRELTLQKPPGNRVGLGNLPPHYVHVDTRTLPGGEGYIALNIFLDPVGVSAAMAEAVQRFSNAPGIVLDLRGNPGGISALGAGVAGFFLDTPNHLLGTMQSRETTLKLTVNPRQPNYAGPLAILIDGASASTTEIVAGGLQDAGRARIFGTRSAGAALPSIITRLPSGDGFLHAIADYTSAGGKRLEGFGVTPDEEVRLTRAALLAGRDDVIDAAVKWIQKQAQTGRVAGASAPRGAEVAVFTPITEESLP